MAEGEKDQRRYPRIPAEHAILVKRIGEDEEEEGLAKTQIVGLGGCMFVHEQPLELGAVIEMLLNVHSEVIRATARVTWVRPHAPKGVEVGVEFLFISDAHKNVLQRLFPKGSRS
jgi:hypothetical protein